MVKRLEKKVKKAMVKKIVTMGKRKKTGLNWCVCLKYYCIVLAIFNFYFAHCQPKKQKLKFIKNLKILIYLKNSFDASWWEGVVCFANFG